MKNILMVLALIPLMNAADASCTLSIKGSSSHSAKLASILETKGYQIVKGQSQANLIISIVAENYAWSDGPETFAYAVPSITAGGLAEGSCPYIDVWNFSTREKTFHKKLAIKNMLNEIEENFPIHH